MSIRLGVSIVSHSSDESELRLTLTSLLIACVRAHVGGHLESVSIFLVDNGPVQSEREKINAVIDSHQTLLPNVSNFVVLGVGVNLGFGAGHNLAFDVSTCDLHLVLNPDVELEEDALAMALQFMADHAECGALAPAVVNLSGGREFLCKRYPTLFGLFLRGFTPPWLRQKGEKYLAHYEMRDMPANTAYWDPPIISGCFMLLRTEVLKKIGGFDSSYFLYFEDFDLSLRIANVARIAYVSAVKITHSGGNASRKGLRHVWLFSRSALTFFNRYGWKFW